MQIVRPEDALPPAPPAYNPEEHKETELEKQMKDSWGSEDDEDMKTLIKNVNKNQKTVSDKDAKMMMMKDQNALMIEEWSMNNIKNQAKKQNKHQNHNKDVKLYLQLEHGTS